ncbi:MAG TPA: ASKHA domain-containing protein [bacterium]|nr:ASKHA domain-containing protein [bacterium]
MHTESSVTLTFLPKRISAQFPAGITILEAARRLGIDLSAYCGGNGVCGRCRVRVHDLDIPPSEEDQVHLSAEELRQGWRLACTSLVYADGTVAVAEAAADEERDILSEGETRRVALQPAVRALPVTTATPDLHRTVSDEELLLEALQSAAPAAQLSPLLLPQMSEQLRQYHFSATAILIDDLVADLQPPDQGRIYGLAVDLGTTTVVSKLIDLTSGSHLATAARLNAQRSYGEDVIGRISYASTSREHTLRLQQAVIDLLNDSIAEMCRACNVEARHIYQAVIAGNTVMQHLLLGLDAKYLAQMPYVPVFRRSQKRLAADLGLALHPASQIYFMPIIGRFVGGDTSAVLLSLAEKQTGIWLAVDIGTNGEMILAKDGQFWSTSAAAGPAFEGAAISQGMRAGEGAIDRVSSHAGRWDIHVIGDGPATGICGSGLIDAVGALVQTGCLDFTGRLQPDGVLPIIRGEDQSETISLSGPAGGEVRLSQKDIREVQLAKSAIASAIQILLKAAGVGVEELDALYLAGAFGQYIRKDMAKAIGLLPNIQLDKIHFIGNAAYVGAELALRSTIERAWIERMAGRVQYVEVAGDPEFQTIFSDHLFFPTSEQPVQAPAR